MNGELFGRVTTAPWGMVFPAAERFYCVHRYAKRLGNLAIAVSSRTEFNNLCFLIIGHILSAPSEG